MNTNTEQPHQPHTTGEDAATAAPIVRYADPAKDLHGLAERLREADRIELTLAVGPDIQATLELAAQVSGECFVAETPEDGVIAFFGVTPTVFPEIGSPWMVGTDAVLKYPKGIMEGGRWATERWLEKYPTLANYVHAENEASIAWLQHLGYSLGKLVHYYGVAGAPFYQFYRHRTTHDNTSTEGGA